MYKCYILYKKHDMIEMILKSCLVHCGKHKSLALMTGDEIWDIEIIELTYIM